jgi:Ca2+-binding RTX toxin-like protein
VIGNDGQDIFSNFAAADTFLGGTTGIVQIKQSNYLHDKGNGDYLHIEQITAADLNDAIGPQMAAYDAVEDTPGLRLVDGEDVVGFAQAKTIQVVAPIAEDSETYAVIDTLSVGVIEDELGNDLVGLRLFKDVPSENDKAHRLLAGMGDDVIMGGSNTDVIVGNGGNDWIGGGAGSDILAAGSGDVASSGSNPDNIFGNVGSAYESTIVGGAGDDTLVAIEGDVIATGGEGSDTFAFYGAQVGLQTHLTIADFEIGIDRIDISKLLGEQWLTGSANLDGYLDDIITNAIVDADGVHLDLSSLMSDANSEGAQVQLTIEYASTQTVGADGAIEATVINGQDIKNALSTSVFETTSLASDMWFSDLAPLTYPNAI